MIVFFTGGPVGDEYRVLELTDGPDAAMVTDVNGFEEISFVGKPLAFESLPQGVRDEIIDQYCAFYGCADPAYSNTGVCDVLG